MKKIIALVLAIVMMAAMSVVVFAAGAVGGDSNAVFDGENQKVEVRYSTAKGYSVTIPANFEISADTRTGTTDLKLTRANLTGGEVLTVKVKGDNGGLDETWLWKLVDSKAEGTLAAPVGYNISVEGAGVEVEKVAQNGAILTYTSSPDEFGGMQANLTLTADVTNQVANFVDYLTFSVELTGGTPAEIPEE